MADKPQPDAAPTADRSSRLPGFYKLDRDTRLAMLGEVSGLSEEELGLLRTESALPFSSAETFIENAVGTFSLPLGIATNFTINGRDTLVPMVVEESSVVAAASFGAKLARAGGGFQARLLNDLMIGQVQLLDFDSADDVIGIIEQHRGFLLQLANESQPGLIRRGGGARDLKVRRLRHPKGEMIVLHLHVDCKDAMGANIVNTMIERLGKPLADMTGARVGLKILSNLADQQLVEATCIVPKDALTQPNMPGYAVVKRIVEAYTFAFIDPYRATTHNKGIMNGIDPVAIATGNDWRAVEAGAHAYAARDGQYRSLSEWWRDETGDLRGRLVLPLSVGTVGGVTKLHPTAKLCLKLMGNPSAAELSGIMASVGLAQNLSAIRALATEGIQQGHMKMHAKNIALLAGATTDAEVAYVADQLVSDGHINAERAGQILVKLRNGSAGDRLTRDGEGG